MKDSQHVVALVPFYYAIIIVIAKMAAATAVATTTAAAAPKRKSPLLIRTQGVPIFSVSQLLEIRLKFIAPERR